MIVGIDSPLGDNALIARGGRPETPEKIIIRNKKLSVQRRTDNLFKKAMTCSAIMMKRMDYYRGTERRGYHMIDADMDEFLIAAVMISKKFWNRSIM